MKVQQTGRMILKPGMYTYVTGYNVHDRNDG